MNQLKQYFKLSIVSICLVLPGFIQAELMLIDQINCVVCGPAYNKPFVDTDITWKRIPFEQDNKFVPLQKQIQSDIVMQQVMSEKMPLDPTAVEKHIEGIKRQLKVNDAEFAEIFESVGRTLAEGLEWIANLYTSEFFTHYKFKSQMVPNDEDIENYYNENPEFDEGSYGLRIARVPYDENKREDVKKLIEQAIVDKDDADGLIVWGRLIVVPCDDLSADQRFVADMQPGDIRVHETEGMFELVQLETYEPTKIKSLNERRSEIIDILNRKKLESMLQTYNDSVREFVDIIPLTKPAEDENQ